MTLAAGTFTELRTPDRKVQLAQLVPDAVAANWDLLYPFLEKLDQQEPLYFAAIDVLPLVRQGSIQLWLANDQMAVIGVVLTEVKTYPRTKVCNIVWFCGHEVLPFIPAVGGIEAWAASHACDYMVVRGRRGWQRVLEPLGYELNGFQLIKPIVLGTEH